MTGLLIVIINNLIIIISFYRTSFYHFKHVDKNLRINNDIYWSLLQHCDCVQTVTQHHLKTYTSTVMTLISIWYDFIFTEDAKEGSGGACCVHVQYKAAL